jgi:hypothetical protein
MEQFIVKFNFQLFLRILEPNQRKIQAQTQKEMKKILAVSLEFFALKK